MYPFYGSLYIENAIYIGDETNEDKQKHPNIEKYKYFATGLKIGNEDFTCKSVVGIDKKQNCYYDQSLSTIEKGKLVDFIKQKNKSDNLSPLITQREIGLQGNEMPYVYYDKRLINICQVPQYPFLDENLEPRKEIIDRVRSGENLEKLLSFTKSHEINSVTA